MEGSELYLSRYNVMRTVQSTGEYKYEMVYKDMKITETHSINWPASKVIKDMEFYLDNLRRNE